MPTSNQVPFVKVISNEQTTVFDQFTSPECVMRFSSDPVVALSSRNGAARTVKKIVHSVIKIVVSLYMLAVSEGPRYRMREEDVRGMEHSTCTYFDIQSTGPYIPGDRLLPHIRHALREILLLCQL